MPSLIPRYYKPAAIQVAQFIEDGYAGLATGTHPASTVAQTSALPNAGTKTVGPTTGPAVVTSTVTLHKVNKFG